MMIFIRPAVVMLLAFTVVTGIAYPLALTGIAQVVARGSANGSVLARDGVPVGSVLIGQAFTADRYFQGRPSSAGEKGYDASASSGSNLGPLSKKLMDRVEADVAAFRKSGTSSIPADGLTSSASGLDPHISPAFAALQVGRIAVARKASEERVRAILERYVEGPALGVIGEPRVNVLLLNLALDVALPVGAG
jgi:potassium-transporting ATPase KdpC subunit